MREQTETVQVRGPTTAGGVRPMPVCMGHFPCVYFYQCSSLAYDYMCTCMHIFAFAGCGVCDASQPVPSQQATRVRVIQYRL